MASSCTSVNARRASRCSSSRSALAAAGSESSRTRGDLEVGGEPDQILLHALVQGPLDAATFGIGGQREAFPRGSELLDLAAQPIEGWLLVGLLGLQRMPPAPGLPGSCPSSLGRRQAGSTVSDRRAASRRSPGLLRIAGGSDLLASANKASTHEGRRDLRPDVDVDGSAPFGRRERR